MSICQLDHSELELEVITAVKLENIGIGKRRDDADEYKIEQNTK